VACLKSPAKLNLGLSIVGRRDDGYHRLESLFWPIDFADTVVIEELGPEDSRVHAEWSAQASFPHVPLPQGNQNLVHRALIAAGLSRGYRITLEKQVPLGGGLGGGSSNAGTILKHLVREGTIARDAAERIASEIGADVPFFLDDHPSWVTGIGEQRTAVRLAPALADNLYFLVVLLPQPTLTATVFARYRELGIPFSRPGTGPDAVLDWPAFASYLRGAANDLERPAVASYPLIGQVLRALRGSGAEFSGLSGSGSSCFSVFRTEQGRSVAAKELQDFFRRHQCKGVMARSHGSPETTTNKDSV
jgi:4-diphosphocytidyl-2-C-methyl-D-erythritol kinase